MWHGTIKKYYKAALLIRENPREFKLRLIREINRPSTLPFKLLRKVYFLFVTKRDATNQNRFLLVYDLKVNPVTFDFLTVLFYAEKLRMRHGKKHLDVVFINADNINEYREPDYIKNVGETEIAWRVTNLLIPITRLLTSVSRISVVCEASAFEIINKYDAVHPIGYSQSEPKPATIHLQDPELKFSDAIMISPSAHNVIWKYFPRSDDRLIVTITIRSYDYLACRNSNIQAWVEFAKKLDPTKYRVIIIPDASPSGVENIKLFDGLEVFDVACWNLELRAALYSRAFINMGIDSGPITISCMLGNVISVVIDPILETPQDYLSNIKAAGYVPGEKLLCYSETTTIVLGRDDKDTITKAFWDAVKKHGKK